MSHVASLFPVGVLTCTAARVYSLKQNMLRKAQTNRRQPHTLPFATRTQPLLAVNAFEIGHTYAQYLNTECN